MHDIGRLPTLCKCLQYFCVLLPAACTTRYNRLESLTFIGVQSKDAFAALLHNPELNVVEMEWSSAFVFAKQMNATTISLPSSDASLLSYPNEIAQLILNAAKVVAAIN